MEHRIKPFTEIQAEQFRRDRQMRLFRRNQAMGLLLLASLILVYWLFKTNPAWIFPTGWWRL